MRIIMTEKMMTPQAYTCILVLGNVHLGYLVDFKAGQIVPICRKLMWPFCEFYERWEVLAS